MKIIKTCLLLGRKQDTLKIKNKILKKNWKVICKNKIIEIKDLDKIDLIITFNYRHLIKKFILKRLKRPAINLHISYLPFNRGCHPNFWSFIENSVKGVTIHEIDNGLDTGPILFQNKIFFNINKKKHNNFFKTNQILNSEIEKLFLKNINQILNKKYETKKQVKGGSFHYRNDLPTLMKNNWKIKIKNVIKIFGKNHTHATKININRVFLRELRLSDVNKNYLSWFNDEKIHQFIKKKINTINDLKTNVKFHLKKKNVLFYGIFLKKNKKHIGNIKFELKKKSYWLGILIGSKNHRNQGIGQEVINKSIKWIFEENKKISTISLIVKRDNINAIKAYKNCKFQMQKILKKSDEFVMVVKNPYVTQVKF